jgi:hypothetical protein
MTTLEREVIELKARVEYLEAIVRQLVGKVYQKGPAALDEPLDLEQLLARCKAEGVVRDPTPEEHRLAEEWNALPEEEKQAHIRVMRHLVLDPPLSQIITENRH